MHLIEIDGTNAGGSDLTAVLDFGAGSDGSVVRGLVINRCRRPRFGSRYSTTSGHVIEGNFLGTDPDGHRRPARNGFGILIDIGATNVHDRRHRRPPRATSFRATAGIGIGIASTTAAAGTRHSGQFHRHRTPPARRAARTASASRCTPTSRTRRSAAIRRGRATSSRETRAPASGVLGLASATRSTSGNVVTGQLHRHRRDGLGAARQRDRRDLRRRPRPTRSVAGIPAKET